MSKGVNSIQDSISVLSLKINKRKKFFYSKLGLYTSLKIFSTQIGVGKHNW